MKHVHVRIHFLNTVLPEKVLMCFLDYFCWIYEYIDNNLLNLWIFYVLLES